MSKLINRMLILLIFANIVFDPFKKLNNLYLLLSFLAMGVLLVIYYFQEYILSKKKIESKINDKVNYLVYTSHHLNDNSRSIVRGYVCLNDKYFYFVDKNSDKVFKRNLSMVEKVEKTKISFRKGYNIYFYDINDSTIFCVTGIKVNKSDKIMNLGKK